MNIISKLLITHPLKINMITAGFMAFLGDTVCQYYFDNVNEYDTKRTWIMCSLAVAGTMPQNYWYKIVPSLAAKIFPRGVKMTLIITLMDQILFAPVFNATWLFGAGFLEQFSPKRAVMNVKEKWLEMMIADCSFWPFVTLFNFTFITPHYRLIFLMSINLIWNTLRSWIQYHKRSENNYDDIRLTNNTFEYNLEGNLKL